MKWTVFTVLPDGTTRHYGTYPDRDIADRACQRLQDAGVRYGDCPAPEWDHNKA